MLVSHLTAEHYNWGDGDSVGIRAFGARKSRSG